MASAWLEATRVSSCLFVEYPVEMNSQMKTPGFIMVLRLPIYIFFPFAEVGYCRLVANTAIGEQERKVKRGRSLSCVSEVPLHSCIRQQTYTAVYT